LAFSQLLAANGDLFEDGYSFFLGVFLILHLFIGLA
jgi:hypothetical protein